MKLYTFRYVDEYEWLLNSVRDLFKLHDKSKSRDRIEIFQKFSIFAEILFKFTIGMYITGCIVIFMFTVHVYLTTGEMIPVIPIFIPGIDATTPIGYTIHTIFHIILMIFVAFGFASLDFLIAILITSSLIFSKLIAIDFKQINPDLSDKNKKMIDAIGRFRNVLLMHREMGEFMKRIERVTFAIFFVHIGCATCGAMVWLYVILMVIYCFIMNEIWHASFKRIIFILITFFRCIIYRLFS